MVEIFDNVKQQLISYISNISHLWDTCKVLSCSDKSYKQEHRMTCLIKYSCELMILTMFMFKSLYRLTILHRLKRMCFNRPSLFNM